MANNIGSTLEVTMPLLVVVCASCTVPFAMPADMNRRRREDGKKFYCPAGHENVYNGETFEELKKKNQELQAKVKSLEDKITVQPPPPPPKPRKARGARRDDVLAFVKAAGKPVTRNDIRQGLGVYASTVYRAAGALIKAGSLVEDAKGWLSCPG